MAKLWKNSVRIIKQKGLGKGSRSQVLLAIYLKKAQTAVSFTEHKWASGFPEKKPSNKTRGSGARASVDVSP